jgi:peptidyl-dipeptidase Dcp
MNRFLFPLLLALLLVASCASQTAVENPLLAPYGTAFEVPPFDRLEPEHFEPAFAEAMRQEREDVEAIAANPDAPTFENTIVALDRAGGLLSEVRRVFGGLTGTSTNDALQQINQRTSPLLAAHRDEVRLNPGVFARVEALYQAREDLDLTAEQRFLLEKMYRDGVRNGALLDADQQAELKQINQSLSKLGVQFRDNLLAETNGYELVVTDPARLAGLPDAVMAAAASAAVDAGHADAWMFTTQKPSMLPLLTYGQDRDLRRQVYTAYTSRGNQGNEHDNTAVVSEVLALRQQKAQLLGYPTYAHYELERRMAGTPDRVDDLLGRLWEAALPVAHREIADMQAIIDAEGGGFQLAAWDWWYYAEKVRKQQYDLDDNELRPYFQLERVRDGVFWVANQLFGLEFSPLDDLPLPHPEAEAFRVTEADGSHCAVIYLDYHPRASKRQGAWCGTYRPQSRADGQEVDPIVNLVCNFTRASGDTPALLSLDEVETLFHEFGHALDNMLSDVTYNTLYRSSDFSELPSQIMEHWALEPTVLRQYARHYKTGEPMPDALIEKITASGHFNQGFATVEYLAASLLDMEFHTMDVGAGLDVMAHEASYLADMGLMPEIAPRYRASYFGHIIGGYAAGYYSYIWSGVLDNDAFEAFRETSLFDQETADRFRRTVLARNGTADFMEMYVDFRGREPRIEPLLRKRGLM